MMFDTAVNLPSNTVVANNSTCMIHQGVGETSRQCPSRISSNSVFQDQDREMRAKAVKRFINHQRKINFEEAYRVGAVLGKGGFGIVYAGVRSKDRREVAIKHVARNKVEHWANLNGKRVPLELKLLHSVQSVSGVIRLLDFFERPA